MSTTSMRIAVIGSGILGASVAWHLARRGASVQLFDEGPVPASGVTGRAFGWINVVNGKPLDDPAGYRLLREGVAEYRRLGSILPEALRDARPGSLLWLETGEATEALVRAHQAAGAAVELVDAEKIAQWEPQLSEIPPCAAFSPGDLALSPAVLAEAFAKAAMVAGATMRFGERVIAVETLNGRVTGVRTANGVLPSDIVVIAAGTASNDLTGALGGQIGVESSPSILLRYAAPGPFISRILRGPGLEIRQWHDHSLFVATSYIDGTAENSPEAIGRRTLEKMKRRFAMPDGVRLTDAVVGHRPIFPDGLPRLGFLPRVEGAYVAVGHPGVILAPLMGRLAAEEIIDGRRSAFVPSP